MRFSLSLHPKWNETKKKRFVSRFVFTPHLATRSVLFPLAVQGSIQHMHASVQVTNGAYITTGAYIMQINSKELSHFSRYLETCCIV